MKNSLLNAVVGFILTILFLGIITGCSGETTDNYSYEGYDEQSLKLSYSWVGVGDTFGAGPVNTSDHESLAKRIFETREQFDADNGGAGAFCSNPCMREKFYEQLKDDIDADPDLERNEDMPNTFTDIFEDTFGDLPDHDNDGKPDIIDEDDDGDGVDDDRDDDDDNDGCLDKDEADGNSGGVNNEPTGEGRGEGNNKGEYVDPTIDPGDTSRFDDG